MKNAAQRLIEHVSGPLAQDLAPDTETTLSALLVRMERLERIVEAMGASKPVTHADQANNVNLKADRLATACADLGLPISADGFVREYHAARLVNRSAFTLRNWRYAERPLPYRTLGGRIEYRLTDLADFLDGTETH